MEKLQFKISIKASKEKIWKVLWEDETYRKWSGAFYEGSYAVSDWNEGGKIHFLGPDGGGMNSVIEKKIPNEYMAFKHLGEMKDFKEVPPNEETEKWAGAMETYRLTQKGDQVEHEVPKDGPSRFHITRKNEFFRFVYSIGFDIEIIINHVSCRRNDHGGKNQ